MKGRLALLSIPPAADVDDFIQIIIPIAPTIKTLGIAVASAIVRVFFDDLLLSSLLPNVVVSGLVAVVPVDWVVVDFTVEIKNAVVVSGFVLVDVLGRVIETVDLIVVELVTGVFDTLEVVIVDGFDVLKNVNKN